MLYRVNLILAVAALVVASLIPGKARADDTDDCQNGVGDDAIVACTRIIERGQLTGPQLSEPYTYRCIAYRGNNNLDAALADCSKAIALDPKFGYARYTRAGVYWETKQYDLSIADLNEAIRLRPDMPDSFWLRGVMYDAKKDYDRAIADYSQAIRLDPKYADAYLYRGLDKQTKGDGAGGAADIAKAKQLQPDIKIAPPPGDSRSETAKPAESPNTAQASAPNLDDARDACDHKSGDVSIAGCTALISSNPSDSDAYFNRAIEYNNKKDYDRAFADYSQAISVKPDNAAAYHNRGLLYFQQKNDISHAITDYTKAIDLNSASALASRGHLYQTIGANELALTDLNAAVSRNPKSNAAVYYRGVLFEQMGRKDDAIADFRQALVIDPTDQDSKDALKRLTAKP